MNLTQSLSGQTLIAGGRPRRALQLAVVGVSLLIVFPVDRATGSAPVQHLYYVPIILAALWFKRMGGMVAAGAAIVLYHLANPHLLSFRYNELDLVQIGLFIAVGVVTARLVGDAQRLRALATTDDLTGLHNLRSFEVELGAIVQRARVTGSPVSLLVLDVDRLKSMNDRHGHLAGSEAVRQVGRIIAETVPLEAGRAATVATSSLSPCRTATSRAPRKSRESFATASTRSRPFSRGFRSPRARCRSASASPRGRCFAVSGGRPMATWRAAKRCSAPPTARSTSPRIADATPSALRDR